MVAWNMKFTTFLACVVSDMTFFPTNEPRERHLGGPKGAACPFAIFGDLAYEAGLLFRWAIDIPPFFRGDFWSLHPLPGRKDRFILSLVRGKWVVYIILYLVPNRKYMFWKVESPWRRFVKMLNFESYTYTFWKRYGLWKPRYWNWTTLTLKRCWLIKKHQLSNF